MVNNHNRNLGVPENKKKNDVESNIEQNEQVRATPEPMAIKTGELVEIIVIDNSTQIEESTHSLADVVAMHPSQVTIGTELTPEMRELSVQKFISKWKRQSLKTRIAFFIDWITEEVLPIEFEALTANELVNLLSYLFLVSLDEKSDNVCAFTVEQEYYQEVRRELRLSNHEWFGDDRLNEMARLLDFAKMLFAPTYVQRYFTIPSVEKEIHGGFNYPEVNSLIFSDDKLELKLNYLAWRTVNAIDSFYNNERPFIWTQNYRQEVEREFSYLKDDVLNNNDLSSIIHGIDVEIQHLNMGNSEKSPRQLW